jgi:hypothetical protein
MPNSNDMNNPVETNENELTGQYSPVSSFTQRVDILSKENKLEYPKYRTLSEEQTRTYIKATELPDVQRKSMALDLAKAKEQDAAKNAKNAVIVEMASMMSGVGTEAALGNILVTDDYSPVVSSAAEAYAGGKIAQAVGGGALKQAGAFALGTAAMGGLLTALSPTELGGEDTPQEIFDSFYRPKFESLEKDWKSGKISYDEYTQQTKDLNNQFETTVKSRFPNTNFQEQIEQSLKSQGYTDEQIERLKQPTKVQSLGLRLTQSAMDRLEYRTSVMPQVDADSVAARFATAPMSAGEYLMTGVGVAKLARTAIKASKMPTDRFGRKAAEFTAQKGTKYEDVVDRYAGMVGNKIGSGAATAQMSSDIMGQGALESIQKYIEDTGDTELTNYTGDIRKAALDAFSTHTQNVVEKMGFNKFIKNPRAVKKWGEWGNGFVQEFTQGEINDVSEFVKGNQELADVINNIPYNVIDGVAGSWTQGTIGTAYFNYYHNKNVNDLVDVIMAQKPNKSEQEVRQFAENKVKDIENEVSVDVVKEIVDFTDATQYQGKIYENIRDNVKKAIDYQMDIMKDTDEGSEFENLTEDELAQYVEQVAHDETDKVVIESLEQGTPLSESPRLKGITIAGTYYLEGEDYAQETKRQAEETRQALLNAVYAEREAQRAQRLADQMAEGAERARERRIRAESAQQTKEAEQRVKLDEKSAKEIAKQVEKSLKEQVKSTNNIKIATTKAIKSGNVETIGKVLSDNGFAVRNMSGTQIKLLAKLNWQLFKGMDLGESMRSSDKRVALSAIEKNVESGNAVLTRAGYTKEQIDSMDDETWNRAVLTQYRKENQEQEPELTEEQLNAIPDDLQFQDLADENESLDAIYPEYTGDTIEVDGKERTVYNSNGDRIAKSKEALTNFWRWFGDSKVVDEQGRPLVVYHGSDVSGIEVFDNQANQTKQRQIGAEKGYFFTDSKKVAERFRTTEQRKAESKYYAENTIIEPVTEEKYDAQGRYLGSVHYTKTTLPESKNFGLYPVYLKAESVNEYSGEDIGVGEERATALESAKQSGKDGVIIYKADTGAGIANEYIVFDSTQIKSVDNRGTYSSDTGNIYYQETEPVEDKLVVTHGISLNSLEKSLDLGGFPMPSIAITKATEPLGDFGTISLIGTKNIIDPANPANKVYDRDIWSITFPTKTYKNAKRADIKEFNEKFRSSFAKSDDTSRLDGSILHYAQNSSRPEQAVDSFVYSDGAKIYYIENVLGEKVDVPTYDKAKKILDNSMIFVKADEKFIQELSEIDLSKIDKTTDLDAVITKPIQDLLDRFDFAAEYGDKAKVYEEHARQYYSGDKFGFSQKYHLVQDIKDYIRSKGQFEVDRFELSKMLDEKLKDDSNYEQWATKQIEKLLGEPKVAVGKKLEDWTLANIVKSMIKNAGVNAQKSLVYGSGKVIASGAKKLSSIKEIKEIGQGLKSKEEASQDIEKIQDAMDNYTNQFMTVNDITGSLNQKEEAYMALGRAAGKTPTKESLQSALNYELGNRTVYDDKVLEEGVEIIKAVRKLSRHYFEAKPQRIVRIEEFVGAVVPTDKKYDNISKRLAEKGLSVERTDDLRQGIQNIESSVGRVLFQTQKQSRKGGAYDPRTRSITLGSGANVTTFPHEFAHYWIEKNFKWARSGKASQEWMRQWSAVEKWLGIDPDDKYLDKAASEKFARAYERFLGEEQVPLVLKKSLGDFRDFVLDHYDFELDEAKGLTDKFGRPIKLNDDVKNWFKKSIYETYSDPVESEVVVERLRKDAEDNKEIKQADQENETIRENVKNSESFKTADAETNLMDVQKSAGISNEQIIGKREIGGGEQKESKGKIAEQLGGRTYESTSWEIQEQMVEDYLKTVSLDQALEDLDNETYPEKIDPNFLRSALTEKLLDAGREMEATALIEETADDFSDAAQRLQAARTLNTPFTNAIQTLNIAKAEQLARAKFGNKKTAVADLDAAMNRLVAKYEKDFLNAETDEEREMVYAALQDEAVRTIGSLNKDESSKLDFQTIEDKEERKQAREIRKQQKRRASIKAYRGKAKRALKQALGLEPTRQQVREIRKRAVKVQKAIADFRKDVRQNKTSAIDPIKVLEAQNELNNYMNSQLPTRYLGTFADAANSYMMANMLWNPATNVFNLESTWVQMIPHLVALAINNGTFGTISAREKAKIIKSAIITQIKTGYNIFSLRDFFDNKTIWAEKFYEAQSVLGKGIRAPLTALGLMDTMNKGIVFLQAVDSMATKQAREEGKKNGWTAEQVKQRAKELFYQALNTDPRTITIDGLKIRKAAVQEGEEATFTQNTRTAQIVNKVRKALNFGGKTGLGNVIMPFTTTIANIAEDTVVNYSLGLVKNTPKAVKAIATQFDKTATAEMKKEAWKEVLPETKNAIKNVIGILILLSFALGGDDDDYVLGYDRQTAKDKDIRTNRNAPNGYAVRLGDKWIDLDLFGIGSQYAKMYMIARRGNFEPDAWTNAIVSGVDLLPGVSELQSMYDTFTDMSKMKGEWEGVSELASDKIEELSVRIIPASAFFGQIASIADTSKRETWNNWYDKMKAKIPVLRETLPERTSTQTGEVIPQTDTVFNLATGSRIKDYIEPTGADEVRYEFADSGKPLSYREGNSKLKELGKDTVAYKKAVNRVRKDFTKKLENISDNPEYQRLDIDQKRKVVNELHKEALTDVKVDLGLEKPKKATKKRLKKQGKNDNLK